LIEVAGVGMTLHQDQL